jgi:hypothetical protein
MLMAAALAGLVLGHLLDYLIVVRDPHVRRAILHLTGHGYLASGSALAVVAAGAALVAAVGRGLRSGAHGRDQGLRWRGLAAGLALTQTAGFVTLEVGERLVAGAPLGDLAHSLTLPLGIALQALLAAVAAFVLLLAERGGRAIATRLGRRQMAPRRQDVPRLVSQEVPPRDRLALGSLSRRGPPAPSLA